MFHIFYLILVYDLSSFLICWLSFLSTCRNLFLELLLLLLFLLLLFELNSCKQYMIEVSFRSRHNIPPVYIRICSSVILPFCRNSCIHLNHECCCTIDSVVAASYNFYHQLQLFHLTLSRSLWLYSFWLAFFSVLSSESASQENNGSLISIVSSIYIMKSSRSGSLLWCLLIFGTCLFHLSVRPSGSFQAIMQNMSAEFKVFHLWLTAILLHFSRKPLNFLNFPEYPNLICGQYFTSFL